MPIKYSTYDSSSGNAFSVISVTGATGVFTSGISGTVYKASGNVTIISGSGDVRPFGTFSFPSSAGSSGQYLLNNGNNTTSWAALPGYVLDFQEYSGNTTWTKPSDASVVYVELVGGGGGGGAGGRYATTSLRNGGGGGAAGVFVSQWFMATDLSGSVPITVGAGGSGGPAQTVNTTSGSGGSDGGDTSFGNYLNSAVSSGGRGGSNLSVVGGTVSFRGATPYNASAGGGVTAGVPVSVISAFVAGGGGGGGRSANNTTTRSGGEGGVAAGFTISGVAASGGQNALAGEGGGGAGGTYITATTGGRGGNGAYPGGGGGGGAASDNGFNSGSGGNGGGGMIKVWTW